MAQLAKENCAKAEPGAWARRLKLLRPFAQYLRQFAPSTEVPEIGRIFGPVPSRVTPHIFHEQEIMELLAAARDLTPMLRAATYDTLFGLLACTGLRVSEAVHLVEQDVDLNQGLLMIRQTKCAKSRQVPLHESTIAALRSYRRVRSQSIVPTPQAPFFVTARGKRFGQCVDIHSVDRVFAQLRQDLGWPNRGAHHVPRVCTISGTLSPFDACCFGTNTVRISTKRCLRCRPIWVTPRSQTLTGTSPQCPS